MEVTAVMAQELPGFPPRVNLARRVSCVSSNGISSLYHISFSGFLGESQPQQTYVAT